MIRRIDVLGRGAFGVLCIAAMAGLAVPALLAAGVILGVVFAVDGDIAKGLTSWLLAWAAALLASTLFFTASYTAWPLASDWITEWQGYVTGVVIGAVGLASMAYLVFASPLPLYLAVIAPLAATFAVGFAVPGWFLGLGTSNIHTEIRVRQR